MNELWNLCTTSGLGNEGIARRSKPTGYATFPGKEKMSFVAMYTLKNRDKEAITIVRTFIYNCIEKKMKDAGWSQEIKHDERFVTMWFTNLHERC